MAEPLFSGNKIAKGTAIPTGKPNCTKCGLHRTCKVPRLGSTGKGNESILILGESPSEQHQEGNATKHLRKVLRSLNHDLDRDCWKLHTVNCRPPKGRPPSGLEIECCRPMVMSIIQEKKPRKIIALGNAALECLLGHRWTHEQLGNLTRWRGHKTPDRDLKSWLYMSYHPSYVVLEKNPVITNTFKRDIKNAIQHTDVPIDWDYDPEKHVQILTDAKEIKKAIRRYRRCGELVSYDYEGTGLKYHAKGHKIYTASMATPQLGTISFPFYPDIVSSWERFLISDTPKTAHHIQFEDAVSYTMLKVRVANWRICTMQAAHVLDNRRGINSLEFQSYTRLGFLPWGMDIKKYFKKKTGKSANSINSIEKAPIRSVLLYGGLDSLSQSMLAHLPEFEELWVK